MKDRNNEKDIWKIMTILAQFATFVTAFIALFSLKESIFQRESMYKPELFIETSYICAEFMEDGTIRHYLSDKDSLVKTEEIVYPCYNIVNVGFGAAMSANLYWHLEPDTIKNYFERNGINGVIQIRHNNLDTFKLGDEEFEVMNDGTVAGWGINYVMPYKSNEHLVRGYCDPHIGYALSTIMKWKRHYSKSGYLYDSILRVPVTLKYKDINP